MKYKLLLILLLVLPFVYSSSYVLHNVPLCEGVVQVKDTSSASGYDLEGCSRKDEMWTCPCKSEPFDIILEYTAKQYTGYKFVVQYYIGDNNNDDNRRTHSYEGLDLTPRVPEPKDKFSFPEIQIGTMQGIFAVIIVSGVLVIALIVFLIKKVLKGKGTEIESSRDVVQDKSEEQEYEEDDDEDVNDILRKYG